MKNVIVSILLLIVSFALVESHMERCGTEEPTEEMLKQSARVMKRWQERKAIRPRQADTIIYVDTYFHLIQRGDGTPTVSDALFNRQMDILNSRYRGTSFQFVLKGITRTQRDDWIANTRYDDDLEAEIGSALRQGGRDTMNVYFQPGLCEDDFLGYSSVAKWRGVFPANTYSPNDQVHICPDYALPGAPPPFNLGMTLVHEVGHWVGTLYHTFTGSSCAVDNLNDLVEDTPQQASSTDGCPRFRDSCPDRPGFDLVNNYMDYSDDRCMTAFTEGQKERMLALWTEIRATKICEPDEASVKFELQFDDQPQETQWGMVKLGLDGSEVLFRLDGERFDYSNQYVVFEDCIDSGRLNEFFVRDTVGNGLKEPGFYALTVNGRQISRDSQFGEGTSIFVSAGAMVCTENRFFIAIFFDSDPEAITWDLRSNGGKVALDYTSSLPAGAQFYSPTMANSLLRVEGCVPSGIYTITFNDSGGKGFSGGGQWSVFTDDEVFAEGGEFDSKQSRTFQIGLTLSTSEPSETPSDMLSLEPSIIQSLAPSSVPTQRSSPPTTDDVQSPSLNMPPSSSQPADQIASSENTRTLQPTLAPVECFSGSSIVDVLGKGPTAMSNLQIGDRVMVDTNRFEPVYSFGHFSPSVQAEYLEIATPTSKLQVSRDHMVFVATDRAVPASMLRVGDALLDAGGDRTHITSIKLVKSAGAFAPFTPSGRVVVNGIVASSYVAFGGSESVLVGGFEFSFQWLAHSFQFPHRFVCYHLGACRGERYTDDGLSHWVSRPYELGLWLMQQEPVARECLMVIIIVLMVSFSVLEASLVKLLLAFCSPP